MTLVAARDDKREIWGTPRGKGLEAPTSVGGWSEPCERGALRESQKGFQLIFLEEGVDGGAEGSEEEADQHDQPCIGTRGA